MKIKHGGYSKVYPFEYEHQDRKRKRTCIQMLRKSTMEWTPDLTEEEVKTRKRMEEANVQGIEKMLGNSYEAWYDEPEKDYIDEP